MSELTLDELGLRYNCDKSSLGRVKGDGEKRSSGHDYLRKYEFFVERFRYRDGVRLLELGIGPDWNMGASLKIWKDYFQQDDFTVKMVDINPNALRFEGKRIEIDIGDLGNVQFLKRLASDEYDIIVDDASHFWGHQIQGFIHLFPALQPGGVYIIEDIHTSFGPLRDRYSEGYEMDAYEFLSGIAALVTGRGRAHPFANKVRKDDRVAKLAKAIDSITFIKHSCIICRSTYY